MCMRNGNFPCIFTGNLVSDNAYVAVTASNAGGNCEPFPSDFEVSLSSDRCSGSFLVSNGVAKRPGCVFCNGATDIVLEPPNLGFQQQQPPSRPQTTSNLGFFQQQQPQQSPSSGGSVIFTDA